MGGDDVEAEIIAKRDDRREQRAKVIAERNKAKAEEGSEPWTAPQSQAVPIDNNSVKQKPTMRRESQRTPWRAKIGESVKSVLEQLIREENKSIGALCTHEVVEGIIGSLNEVCSRKVMKE